MISIELLSVYTIMFLISHCKKIRHTSSSWFALYSLFYPRRSAMCLFLPDYGPFGRRGMRHCAEMPSHSHGPGNIRDGLGLGLECFTTGAVWSAILATAELVIFESFLLLLWFLKFIGCG